MIGRAELLLGKSSAEEENVWLRLVKHVVNPAKTLLHAKVSPLLLGHEVGLGHELGDLLG